jgi:hypothetical protein
MTDLNTTEKKGNGVFLLIILVLLIALGAMAFLWSRKNAELNACTNQNTLLVSDMNGMNDMMSGYVGNMSNDLKKDFKNMLKTYDALIEKDASKADSLNIQKAKIQGLISQLNNNKRITASQLFRMRKENETLRGIMKSYVKQIDSLNTMNIKLTSDLDQTTTQLTTTKSERDQFKQEAEEKGEKVKKGARLQAYGIQSTGLRMKLNNTTEETTKARNTVQIKSSFTLSENSLADAGRKTVYLQITSPDGRVLQSKSSNIVQTEAGNLAYSDKKEIDYNNQQLDMSIFYDLKGEDAIKGNYKVKIFCDGNLIGTDSFTLK